MFHPLFPQQDTPGWEGGDPDSAIVFPARSIENLLLTEHDSDAHTVCYAMYDEDGTASEYLPRLKVVGSALRDIRASGADVYMRLVAVDADREPHEPWPTDPDPDDRWGHPQAVVEALSDALPAAVVYATSRGVRVLFRLQQLVTPENFRKIANVAMRDVGRYLKNLKMPLSVDESCNQWSRLFRLPSVVRNGKSTADRNYLQMPSPWTSWFPGYDELQQVENIALQAESGLEIGSAPAHEGIDPTALSLVRAMSLAGPQRLRAAARAVSDGRAFFEAGERNNATFRFVQALTDFAAARSQTLTPAAYLSVLRASVLQSQGTPPEQAISETWSMLARAVARHTAMRAYYDQQIEVALEAVRTSTPIVVYTNKTRWVWDPMRKTYGDATSNDQTLLAELGRLHLTAILSDEGKMIPMHLVLRQQGQRVRTLRNCLGMRGSRLVQDPDGSHVLETGIGTIVAVPPVFHEDVAEYLDLIVSSSPDGQLLLEWLATAHRLEYATTALLLHGASGSGKNMIAEALAQCFGGKTDFKKAMDKFNSGMLSSALIHLDEGQDEENSSHLNGVANRFREIIGGETISVEQKGVDPVEVRGNYRMIITANNAKPLPVKNTRSLDDFRAIASRVIHIWMPEAAREYLLKLGGRGYTDDWVRRELGQRTVPGKLAEHISWLQHNLEVPDYKDRFLVPAKIGDWHIQNLLQGTLRDILVAAGTGVGMNNQATSALHVERGKVYISADAASFELVKRAAENEVDAGEVKKAIRVALLAGEPVRRKSNKGVDTVYFPLPTDLLLAVMRPDRPDIFVEEAQIYAGLTKRLAAAA